MGDLVSLMKNKMVCILVVAYNAAKTIVSVLERIPPEIKKYAAEIFVVDDCSPDLNSYLIAKRYADNSRLKNLRVIRNKKNKRYGGNQKFGYNYCIKKGYDIVVMLHGDAQYAPEKIPDLIKPLLESGADLVFGSRMRGDPLNGGMPDIKYVGNKVLSFCENWVLKKNLSEYHSGYRAYNCHALAQVPFNKCTDEFHFDTEIIIQFIIKNLRIKEIPIPTFYGDEVSHVKIFNYGFHVLGALFEYWLNKLGLKKSEKYNF